MNKILNMISKGSSPVSPIGGAVLNLRAAVLAGNKTTIAWRLFKVMQATNATSILPQTFELVISDLSWWDRFLIGVQVLGYVVAAIATGGAALVAKIVLVLADSYWFLRKFTTLNALEAQARDLRKK